MNQEEEKGSSEPKPRYVWDPKKLAWVETTEADVQEPAMEEAAEEPRREEGLGKAIVEAKAEEVAGEAAVEGAPVKSVVEAAGPKFRGAFVRLVALIVDGVVFIILLTILGKVASTQSILNTATGTVTTPYATWQSGVSAAMLLVYYVGFWTWRGQTPGKMLVGAKIVKTDGSPIGIRRALLRFVVYFLYFLVWGLAGGRLIVLFFVIIGSLLIIGFNKRKRGIHDFVAGTVVINSRPKKVEPVEVEAFEAPEAAELPGTSEPSEPSVAGEPETDKQE
jgi:uncharacterized RDD family membrane protein YckC